MTLEKDKELLRFLKETEEKKLKAYLKRLKEHNFDMAEDSARRLLEITEEFLEEQ